MYALANMEVMERIGNFLDKYVQLIDGEPIPRNLNAYRDSFQAMLAEGIFATTKDIQIACLREQNQMIPLFLLEPEKFQKTLDNY